MKQAEGVYRVDLYQRQGKLSIRYIEGVTDFKAVARALFELVTGIQIPAAEPSFLVGDGLFHQEQVSCVAGWVKSKYQEAKETFTALGILVRAVGKGESLALTPEKEKFAIDFLTDILMLYLIKLHWHMILTEWVRRPWQYKSEWMATSYTMFLLIRSKLPKPQ